MITVAIDFDDTLKWFARVWREMCLEEHGIQPQEWSTIKDTSFSSLLKTNQQHAQQVFYDMVRDKEKWKQFHENVNEEELKAIDEARDCFHFLKQKHGLRFVVITARNEAESGEVTRQFCEKHFPGVFEQYGFCSLYREGRRVSKGKMCEELDAVWLIDDNIDYILEAETNGIRGLLFGTNPWTENGKQIHDRIANSPKDWREARDLLDNFYSVK